MQKANCPKDIIRQEIESRFDVCSLLDYVVFSIYTANYDGFCKNWQWFTYDGNKWFLAPYDLDATFGNIAPGYFVFPPEWTVWDRSYQWLPNSGPFYFIVNYYLEDIYSRYALLRDRGVLTSEKINSYFQEWYDRIGENNYHKEYEKWSTTYSNRELVLNEGWTTTDDWTDYNLIPSYDPNTVYEPGEKCVLAYRIWTAVRQVSGVRPYVQLGYHGSLSRLFTWVNRRMVLEDYFLKYCPFIKGDINNDGRITTRDASVLSSYLLTGYKDFESEHIADVNEDGMIDVGDHIGLQLLLGPVLDSRSK